MKCERFDTQIALLVTGELPHRKARKVQRHVDQCAACQAAAEALQANIETLRTLAGRSIDGELRDALRQRVSGAIAQIECESQRQRVAALVRGGPSGDRHRLRGGRLANVLAYGVLTVLVSFIALTGWMQYGAPSRVDPPVRIAAVEPTAGQPEQDAVAPESSRSQFSNSKIVNLHAQEPKRSTVVRLYTGDPRVVFFLVSDSTGGKTP